MSQYDEVVDAALCAANIWYESHRNKRGGVNTNVMTSGMAIAELLYDHFPLTAESIQSARTSSRSPIRLLLKAARLAAMM